MSDPATPDDRVLMGPWRWIAAGAAVLIMVLFVVARFETVGYDLRAYLDAAQRLLDHGRLYQPITQQGTFQPGPEGLYLYAPPLAAAAIPLTLAGATAANLAWLTVHLLAVIATCAILPVRHALRLAALIVAACMYPVLNDSVLGNVSVMVLALAAVTWRWLDRPLGSIALAASISLRPTQGIVLIWSLLRRQWRPVLWTALAGLMIVTVSLPVVGLEAYRDYLTMIRNLGDGVGVRLNMGVASTAVNAGVPAVWATALQYAGYVLAIGALLLGLRRDREVGFMVAIGASLLLSPLLWIHYLALALLPAVLLAQRGRPWPLIVLAPLTWIPILTQTGHMVYPLVALAATLLPLLAPSARTVGGTGHGESAGDRSPAFVS